MLKRPLSLYPAVLWVLIACLFQIRPLVPMSRFHPWFVWIWLVLFALSIVEATLLLRMRPQAAKLGAVICAVWVFWILVRILVAMRYGPEVIAPGVTHRSLFEAVLIITANLIMILYLTRKKFLADCLRYRMEKQESYRWNQFMQEMEAKKKSE